jgi:hypothetical protein
MEHWRGCVRHPVGPAEAARCLRLPPFRKERERVGHPFLPMDSAQNTKGASLEAAPLVPFGNFSLYIYFINLGQVNRKFF